MIIGGDGIITWRQMLTGECKSNGDEFEDLEMTLTAEELDKEFYDGYGAEEGAPFTAWSKNWVYFPAIYDGSEWVASAPRNPCDVKTDHVGGG